MSVSLLLSKIRSIVQRQASVEMQQSGPSGQGFHAMVFLNGRCLADVSMGYGQDKIFEPERRACLARQRQA
jgi:hypothetical protein